MEEIAATISALRDLYSYEGRKMKIARQVAAAVYARLVDFRHQRYERFRNATPAEQDAVRLHWRCQEHRQEIRQALKEIRNGRVPDVALWPHKKWSFIDPADDPLATIRARFCAAYDAAWNDFVAQRAANPIDDEAWNRELERRQRLISRDVFGREREVTQLDYDPVESDQCHTNSLL